MSTVINFDDPNFNYLEKCEHTVSVLLFVSYLTMCVGVFSISAM